MKAFLVFAVPLLAAACAPSTAATKQPDGRIGRFYVVNKDKKSWPRFKRYALSTARALERCGAGSQVKVFLVSEIPAIPSDGSFGSSRSMIYLTDQHTIEGSHLAIADNRGVRFVDGPDPSKYAAIDDQFQAIEGIACTDTVTAVTLKIGCPVGRCVFGTILSQFANKTDRIVNRLPVTFDYVVPQLDANGSYEWKVTIDTTLEIVMQVGARQDELTCTIGVPPTASPGRLEVPSCGVQR